MLSFDAVFASFLILGRLLEQAVERGKKKGGLWVFLSLSLLIFASTSAVPVTKVKNQRSNITKRWWERQCKNKFFWKNFVLRKILEFYMQRTNFSLDLMNDIRSNKVLKDRSKYEYWKLGSSSWAMQKIKEKGREGSFLWMEHKRWRKTPTFFRMRRTRSL